MNRIVRKLLSLMGLLLGLTVQVVAADKAAIQAAGKAVGMGFWDSGLAIITSIYPYLAALFLIVYAALSVLQKNKKEKEEEENTVISKAKIVLLILILIGLAQQLLNLALAILK
ncbi:MAG: hypothetical protein ABIG84_02255 [archaeon]